MHKDIETYSDILDNTQKAYAVKARTIKCYKTKSLCTGKKITNG